MICSSFFFHCVHRYMDSLPVILLLFMRDMMPWCSFAYNRGPFSLLDISRHTAVGSCADHG